MKPHIIGYISAGILLLLWAFPSAAEPEDGKKPETGAKKTIEECIAVIESLASETEKIKAVEKLGTLGHMKSAEFLEDFLLFKWEKRTDDSHHFSEPRRIKERKLSQSRESVAKLRAKAAFSLGRLGFERSIPVLIKVARKDTDPVVREQSLKALRSFRDPTLISIYSHAAVADRSAGNRLQGVVGLSFYPRGIKARTMKNVLKDSNIMVRMSGIQTIGISGRKDLLPLIIEAAYDTEKAVKRNAADALAHFNTPDAAKVLVFLAQDADTATAVSAVRALSTNSHLNSKSFMELMARVPEKARLILLKGGFSMWNRISPAYFKELKKNIPEHLSSVHAHVHKKMKVRQKTKGISEQTEKLKIILTEWEKQCKL